MAKTTIRDIAGRAGVTIATASRALNNAPDVSQATRQRVLDAAALLNYTPNAIAQALKGQRTNTVAFVCEFTERPAADLMFKHFISSLASAVARHGLDLLIHPSRGSSNTDDLVRLMQGGRADVLILADTRPYDRRVQALAKLDLPFITFGRTDMAINHPYVDVDGFAGIAAATEHVISRGHQRISYIGLDDTYTCAGHRHAGFFETMASHGLMIDPALMLTEEGNETALREKLHTLLCSPLAPTAIVAASDLMAITAMRAVEAAGLQVGRQVAVVGFDDLPLAEHTSPPLTTVRQPFDAVADVLSILIQGRIHGDQRGAQQVLLRPELVIRQSS